MSVAEVSKYVIRFLKLCENQQADIRRRDLIVQGDRRIARAAFEDCLLEAGLIKRRKPYEWDHFVPDEEPEK